MQIYDYYPCAFILISLKIVRSRKVLRKEDVSIFDRHAQEIYDTF